MFGSARSRAPPGTDAQTQAPSHPGRTRPHPQSEGDRLPGAAPRGDRGDRPFGSGQVVARLRHHLRRGAAPVRRVDVHLRAAVPRPDGAAAGGRHPQHPAGGGARGQERRPQRPLDGGHDHRDARRDAPPLHPPGRGGVRQRPRPGAQLQPRGGGGGPRRRRGRRLLHPGRAPAAAEEGGGRRPRRADPPGLPAPPRTRGGRGGAHGARREVAGQARSAAARPRPLHGAGAEPRRASSTPWSRPTG